MTSSHTTGTLISDSMTAAHATYNPRRMDHAAKHDHALYVIACAHDVSRELGRRVSAAVCNTSLCLPEADTDGKRGRVDMRIAG